MIINNKGILLHFTSLYEKNHRGSLSKEAYNFIDFLVTHQFSYWQILPTSPTIFGNSPYMSSCSFAGDEDLIDIAYFEGNLLTKEEVFAYYNDSKMQKLDLLRLAYSRFNDIKSDYISFVNKNYYWLHDYALFRTLKKVKNYNIITEFDEEYKKRINLFTFEKENFTEVCFWYFCQYIFDFQIKKIRDYANFKGIKIIGDMPIYVAHDSSDVWGNKDNFILNDDFIPASVAGVPPDYFSKDGQLWGNPLYNWNYLKCTNFDFLVKRINRTLEYVDILRIDHFIGFYRYYAIPYEMKPVDGIYFNAPYSDFFLAIKGLLDSKKLIAEDLGALTEEVDTAIESLGIPRMKVFEFVLEDERETNPYRDYPNYVCYSGTHDNNTLYGWLSSKKKKEIERIKKLTGSIQNGVGLSKDILKKIYYINTYLTIFPIQDLLFQNTKYRMNIPGTLNITNWAYQLKENGLIELSKNVTELFLTKN